jgi:hypothetical protein
VYFWCGYVSRGVRWNGSVSNPDPPSVLLIVSSGGRRSLSLQQVGRDVTGHVRRHRQARHAAVGVAPVRIGQERGQFIRRQPIAHAGQLEPVGVELVGAIDIWDVVAGSAAGADEGASAHPVVAHPGRGGTLLAGFGPQ